MQKHAVILFNMGGAQNLQGIRPFLENLFADPLLLSIPNKYIRKMVANIIINSRIDKIKQSYIAIGGKSPIFEHTYNLTTRLNKLDTSKFYTYCMHYTAPFAKDVLADLQEKDVEKITFFSMYPQYSITTVKASLLDITNALHKLKYTPKVRVVERYYDNQGYIELITKNIIEHLKRRDARDFILLFSAHGIPQGRVKKGDEYPRECEKNVCLVRENLESKGINFKKVILSYQSKVGPVKWTSPYTNEVIKNMKNQNLIIYPLSFTIDNNETLYELAIENAAIAKKHDVKVFEVVECFNDSVDFAHLILDILKEYT